MRTRLAIVALGLTGCSLVYSDTLDKKQCETTTDCGGSGLECVENVCVSAVCTPGCAEGSTCVAGVCRANDAKQCVGDTECGAGNRCGYDGYCYSVWGCLDAPESAIPSGSYQVRASVARIDGKLPETIGEVVATACFAEDPTCASPRVTPDQTKYDAVKRELSIPMSGEFHGYFKISPKDPSAPNAWNTCFIHAPGASSYFGEYYIEQPVALADNTIFATLTNFVMLTPKEGTVLLGTFLYDCGGRPAAGIQVVPKEDPDAAFYPLNAGRLPDKTSKVTSAAGAGFVMNLPPGVKTFDLVDPSATPPRVISTFGLTAQAGGLNFVNFYPRWSAVQQWNREQKRRAAAAASDGGI